MDPLAAINAAHHAVAHTVRGLMLGVEATFAIHSFRFLYAALRGDEDAARESLADAMDPSR